MKKVKVKDEKLIDLGIRMENGLIAYHTAGECMAEAKKMFWQRMRKTYPNRKLGDYIFSTHEIEIE